MAAGRARRMMATASRTTKLTPTMLEADNSVARHLLDSNLWAITSGPRTKKKKKAIVEGDNKRVNVVSEKLCDDIINYIKPTLSRHEGCDLIDIYPGAGVWSRKLHDVLRPRSHLLLEPDTELYKPLLDPLLQRPGTKLMPISGIVWDHLNKVLTPEYLPHQVERRYAPSETPQRNDTLVVSLNLSFWPRKRFRMFDSLTTLVLHQLISSIRPGALFQKYGLVRMLVWIVDMEKASILPRTAQRRKKLAVEAELSTDWICEVAGGDETMEVTQARGGNWFRRDYSIDLESMRRTLQRMHSQGITTPPGRESTFLRDYLALGDDKLEFVAGDSIAKIERPFKSEMQRLEKDYEAGLFDKDSAEFRRLKSLIYQTRWAEKRSIKIHEFLQERRKILDAIINAGSNQELVQQALKWAEDWDKRVSALEKSLRAECILHRDNIHVLQQDPPVLSWDRRYVDPLVVRPNEFFPNVPCALLDIQPKATAPILREIGPGSTRSGDMFDMMLHALMHNSVSPISKVLEFLWPGASEGIFPHCDTLKDPKLGGSPLPGCGELTSRTLSERQLIDILERWMEWPFKPTYAQMVARTVEGESSTEISEEDDHISMFAHAPLIVTH